MKHTKTTRAIIGAVIQMLGIHSMLDAPCGAREWQTPFVLDRMQKDRDFKYLGLDITEHALKENKLLPTILQDLVNQDLPKGYDLILSRDALQHNSQTDVFTILKRFACSDARFFLIGSYMKASRNRDIKTGEYFRINLAIPPYSLIPWKTFDEHYDGKYLYLYNRSQLSALCSRETHSLQGAE